MSAPVHYSLEHGQMVHRPCPLWVKSRRLRCKSAARATSASKAFSVCVAYVSQPCNKCVAGALWAVGNYACALLSHTCRTDGAAHFRTGAAIGTANSKAEVARRNCENKSNVSSEKRELPASSARGEVKQKQSTEAEEIAKQHDNTRRALRDALPLVLPSWSLPFYFGST